MDRMTVGLACALALSSGCGTRAQQDEGGSSEGGLESSSGATGPVEDSGSDAATTSSGDDTSGPDADGGFIAEPDGGVMGECDLWEQDCPGGQKCAPFANDGGQFVNSSHCVELSEDPGQPGDACQVEGQLSGIDTCDVGIYCWGIDGETASGTCVPLCNGSPSNPQCDDPSTTCSTVANEGQLPLCLPTCDPITQSCTIEGEACYPLGDSFLCAPDYSGETGAVGEPCGAANDCDAGLFCAAAAGVAGCTDAEYCCTEYCELDNANCSAAAQGASCEPWSFASGMAPPGLENLGACVVPLD